jgi:hypothetical protein
MLQDSQSGPAEVTFQMTDDAQAEVGKHEPTS